MIRLVSNDHQSTLDEMLDTLNEKTIHQQCIDRLLIDVEKFLNGYSPDIMNDVFHLRQNTYNPQNVHAFTTDAPRNNSMLNYVIYSSLGARDGFTQYFTDFTKGFTASVCKSDKTGGITFGTKLKVPIFILYLPHNLQCRILGFQKFMY